MSNNRNSKWFPLIMPVEVQYFFTCFENLALKGNPLSLQLHSLLPGDILLYGAQLVTLNMAGQHHYKCCLQAIELNHLVLGIETWIASSAI